MKSFFFTLQTALLCVVLTLSSGVSGYALDPSDDLSFSWDTYAQRKHRLMGVREIEGVLLAQVDLLPKSQAPKLARHILELSNRYQFDPAFVLAVIQVESRFRVKVVSPAGAVGLMQVMPATGQKVARKHNLAPSYRLLSLKRVHRMLEDPFFNTTVGVTYLAYLRDRYKTKSPYFLVAAYNVGPARMDELLKRKSFKPTGTKRYYDAIRKGIPEFRFYRHSERI